MLAAYVNIYIHLPDLYIYKYIYAIVLYYVIFLLE